VKSYEVSGTFDALRKQTEASDEAVAILTLAAILGSVIEEHTDILAKAIGELTDNLQNAP
jgi:hypothetical protein